MKTITRSNLYLPMAAMILTAALAIAAAPQQVPFKGAMQGHDAHIGMPSPTTVLLSTTGTGTGTHLGQFSFTQEITINLANLTATGSAHWIAANGDSIDTAVVSSAEPSGDVLKVTEIHTITGGTGRFAGAQGSFTMDRIHNPVPIADGPKAGAFLTWGSFHGTITSPGATH